ncbi:MAG: phosphonate ABC transporter, permease protein PhnE [Betaproteobacteria bacterium]|nr:phosphonate ABC transporter, permease protein PhnE [Betaproteobacteria bacterium]
MTHNDAARRALEAFEREHSGWSLNTLKHWALAIVLIVFFAGSWQLAQVDLARLASGLPKLWFWLSQAWPPKLDELPVFLLRTGETIAMAAIGTAAATLLAIPMAILASRNITPFPKLYYPVRWFLNALRGVDSFVFALLFVASVGLGPFAGVLGIALHTWGSAAKFIADYVENANLGPLHAVQTTGASRPVAISYALLPDVLPATLSTTLYLFEFNVRASTVLGVVGAGGIGHELKNSMDLLDFPRLATILIIILIVVTAIDQLAGWLRKRLVGP